MNKFQCFVLAVAALVAGLAIPRACAQDRKPGGRHHRSDVVATHLDDLSGSGIGHMQHRLLQYMASKVGGIGSPGPDAAALAASDPWGVLGELTVAALADTTEPEKERVKKPKKRKKGATPTTEEGSTSSCFGDCLGGFFAGALFSSDDDDEVVPAGYTETPTIGSFSQPYDAMVSPRNPQDGAVTVWDDPGGRVADAAVVGSLNAGEEVSITERAVVGGQPWLKIVTHGTPATAGWIVESDIVTTRIVSEEAPVPDAPLVEEPYYDVARQKWALLLDLGVPVFTEGQINDEYEKKAISVGLATRIFMIRGFQVNGGVSYIHANGEPKYNYIVGTTTESPSDSRLNIWSFELGLGQLYSLFGPHGFLVWDLGPSVINVRERAEITVIETGVVTGTRKDELSEWRGGFHAKLEAGGLIDVVPIGGYVSYAIFPWHSNHEKSLTFDFLEKTRVVTFCFGITVGVSFF